MKEVKFVNLTDHPICIMTDNGGVTIKPSGVVARVKFRYYPASQVIHEGVVINQALETIANVSGLPDPQDGVIYLVSQIVARVEFCRRREDVMAPDTRNSIRNASGGVVAVGGLVRYEP